MTMPRFADLTAITTPGVLVNCFAVFAARRAGVSIGKARTTVIVKDRRAIAGKR